MIEPLVVLVRGSFAYVTLLILARMMGKKQVSQLTFFDYITGITVGSIAATMTVDLTSEATTAATGLLVWTFGTLLVSVLDVYSRKWRKLTDGEPTVVVQNGQILEANLKQLNYTIDDLRMQLRQAKAFNFSDVEFAVLEPDGKLSVLLKSQLQPITPADMNITTRYKGLPVELVMDSHVLEENLKQVNLDRAWLEGEINRRGHRLQDVYYAELETGGQLYIDLRDDLDKLPVDADISDR